jgi:hypothetical protein
VPLSWPLIGRLEEMRAIKAAIIASDVAGIVVCGEAGVGKSRIVREALSAADSHGREGRLVVGASSARAIPLGAFTAWTPPGVTDTVQLLRGVIESLTTTSSGAAVVVVVDDAHLLDELSTFVVHQIVQRGAAKVVLTALDGEPVPAGCRRYGRVAGSTGSTCGRCRSPTPSPCCRRRWTDPWTRAPLDGYGR